MNTKQKAKQLVKKAMPLSHDWETDNLNVAKKIATLCCDEIIDLGYSPGDSESYNCYKFYLETREEIKKIK